MDDTRVIMRSIKESQKLFGLFGQGITKNKWMTKDINSVKEYERMKTIMGLLEAVEDSEYTKNHSIRVGKLTKLVAEEMGRPHESIIHTTVAAYFHDIGKIKLTEKILRPGRLSREEFNQVKKHPEYGYRILKSIGLDREAMIVLQHHERLDGSGYPNKLKEEKIDKSSLILAVADTFDAMTSTRSYKETLSVRGTLNFLYQNTNKYDEEVIQALHRVLDFRLN